MDVGQMAAQSQLAAEKTASYCQQIARVLQIDPPDLDVPNLGGPQVRLLRQRQAVADWLETAYWAMNTPPSERPGQEIPGTVEERPDGPDLGVTIEEGIVVEGLEQPVTLPDLLLAMTTGPEQRTQSENLLIAWFLERLHEAAVIQEALRVQPSAQGNETQGGEVAAPPTSPTEAGAEEPGAVAAQAVEPGQVGEAGDDAAPSGPDGGLAAALPPPVADADDEESEPEPVKAAAGKAKGK